MIILGIETSCDETACGIVQDGDTLLANAVFSSMDLHAKYGGVVPEIAARSHIESITPVIEQALAEAFPGNAENGAKILENEKSKPLPTPNSSLTTPKFDPWDQIDGIAVTYGAGLGGCLLVGVMTARTLAIAKNKPLFAVNHVEAHAYANFLTKVGSSSKLQESSYKFPQAQPEFPMLGLIVSGGHSQLVLWRDHFDYTLLGQTQDDAIGEAFDKVAKILGLPYPGGPSIEKFSVNGNPNAFKFPKAQMNNVSPALAELRRKEQETWSKLAHKSNPPTPNYILPAPRSESYDFSFSGPKTAVLRTAQKLIGEDHNFPSHKLSERLTEPQKADIAASFQHIAIETVVDKLAMAYDEFNPKSIVIGGGVASSPELRRQLSKRIPIEIQYPDPKLCTDNGAMIATVGCFKMHNNLPTSDPFTLEIEPHLHM